ncbi:BZ3500_MvSof-1268-A1-R1_Chr11-3g03600 [Microbotryum saponariae]|uniref:BZ3500_MvSof-1268-A1-R1_Chr11-3g03600 protein n=1 Tax=Microbotryum saponariae TaxID=289078 RepID=A0A2X0LCY5_9BASI|nr:BZ3500_MvSof-1268-A1-R1_Chr11-3g03600 [Microbotryum saponariae]SDA03609.1 BZ3501_MvSof-1269-A2-R1_Chr11g03177 [Microbotryum saponariae]
MRWFLGNKQRAGCFGDERRILLCYMVMSCVDVGPECMFRCLCASVR